MVFPLIIIGLIVLVVFLIIFIPFIIKIIKILLVVGALVWIFRILRKHFKAVKNLANWEYFVIAISVGAGIIAIGNNFGFFAVSGLPMAVQEPIVQASLSPLNLFLGFIIFVLTMMYIFKKT